jgi:hypothetical protein
MGSFNKAKRQLSEFTATCLRQVNDPSNYPYHLPLREEDQTIANSLWSALQADDIESGITYLHELFWSLCGSDSRDEEEAWKEPLQAFIAVSNLTVEGVFRDAHLITSELATWKPPQGHGFTPYCSD